MADEDEGRSKLEDGHKDGTGIDDHPDSDSSTSSLELTSPERISSACSVAERVR